jgi:general secretion pathway protein B
MSLILDALNRAEQERNEKNHIPTLQSVHSPGDKVAPSLLKRLHLERWLIGLVVAYLAFDFFRDHMPGTAAVLSPPAERAQVSPTPAAIPDADTEASMRNAPAERLVNSQRQTAVVKTEPNKPVSVPAKAAATAVAETAVAADGAELDPIGAPPAAKSDGGQQLQERRSPERRPPERRPPEIELTATQSNTRIDTSAAIASPVTISKPLGAAQSAPNPKVESLYRAPQESSARGGSASSKTDLGSNQGSGAAFSRAQQITDLPLTLRQRIPSLKYGDHSPLGQSVDRQVVLNGSVYKEGDIVVPGLRLVEISEPGIVLEFEGEVFRLSAYNSWINFQ